MGSLGVTSVGSDTLTLALHVLASAGFGITHQFRSESGDASKSNINAPSYRDCLETVRGNVKLLILLPRFFYQSPYLPKSLSTFCKSVHHLKRHMVEMVNAEKLRAAQGHTPEVNLLMLLLKSKKARLLLFGDISSNSQRTKIEGSCRPCRLNAALA